MAIRNVPTIEKKSMQLMTMMTLRILAEVLPCTPNKKKAKNQNFNVDEFNKLSLSNKESESEKDGDCLKVRAKNDTMM